MTKAELLKEEKSDDIAEDLLSNENVKILIDKMSNFVLKVIEWYTTYLFITVVNGKKIQLQTSGSWHKDELSC